MFYETLKAITVIKLVCPPRYIFSRFLLLSYVGSIRMLSFCPQLLLPPLHFEGELLSVWSRPGSSPGCWWSRGGCSPQSLNIKSPQNTGARGDHTRCRQIVILRIWEKGKAEIRLIKREEWNSILWKMMSQSVSPGQISQGLKVN